MIFCMAFMAKNKRVAGVISRITSFKLKIDYYENLFNNSDSILKRH